jgi:hypothetical protein
VTNQKFASSALNALLPFLHRGQIGECGFLQHVFGTDDRSYIVSQPHPSGESLYIESEYNGDTRTQSLFINPRSVSQEQEVTKTQLFCFSLKLSHSVMSANSYLPLDSDAPPVFKTILMSNYARGEWCLRYDLYTGSHMSRPVAFIVRTRMKNLFSEANPGR